SEYMSCLQTELTCLAAVVKIMMSNDCRSARVGTIFKYLQDNRITPEMCKFISDRVCKHPNCDRIQSLKSLELNGQSFHDWELCCVEHLNSCCKQCGKVLVSNCNICTACDMLNKSRMVKPTQEIVFNKGAINVPKPPTTTSVPVPTEK